MKEKETLHTRLVRMHMSVARMEIGGHILKKTHEQSCDPTQLLHSCVHTHKNQKQSTVEVLHTRVYCGTASSCQAMRSV